MQLSPCKHLKIICLDPNTYQKEMGQKVSQTIIKLTPSTRNSKEANTLNILDLDYSNNLKKEFWLFIRKVQEQFQ